ncbi:MAG: cyclase family protein [Chloroflexota bacterium]|nr:cyclase family protein [Chloroflexota bacterium]
MTTHRLPGIPPGTLHDLTHPYAGSMSRPPGIAAAGHETRVDVVASHEKNGIQVSYFATAIHVGTHLDAPRHIIPGERVMEDLRLDRFVTRAYVVDLDGFPANAAVRRAHLEGPASELESGDALLLHTGWGERHWGTEAYWADSPYLADDAAEWFVERRLNLVGYDFFQELEGKKPQIDPRNFTTHQIMLRHDVLNLEHLANLRPIAAKWVWLLCLPLRIAGAEGAATRAIAVLPDEAG